MDVSTKRARAVGAGICLLAAAACGNSGTTAGHPPSPSVSASMDPGPECAGRKAAQGLHVLLHAKAALPGGTEVAYDAAHADGTSRTAELATGSIRHTVKVAQHVTLAGHVYTVAEICTYRVVLTGPGLHAPAETGGKMSDWPTTRAGVLSLLWHVPVNSRDDSGVDKSIVVTDIAADPPRCDISTVMGKEGGGTFRDVPVGGTVEFAGRLWQVQSIDLGNMDAAIDSSSFAPGAVRLKDLGRA
ncbi:hypothetical protein [Actinacidiphila sp. bgisy144]|uniref:hypothetical protein n=1 Tax=Actinacidiphila sp. bgisy144 TaxID=3413791 RepID=UPI003EB9D9A6